MDLSILNLEEVINTFGTKTLSDPEYTRSELLNAVVEEPVELDGVFFSFGAAGSFAIQLFNSPDDADTDGVIGTETDRLIVPEPGQVWLKYQVRSDLKAAAGGELSRVGFEFAREKAVVFSAYRHHPDAAQKLRKAVLDDFSPFLFLANPKHLQQLKANEVLAVSLPGKMRVALALDWSDLFTGSLSLFEKLLGPGQVFSLDLSAGASATFAVDVQDEFGLRIRKNPTGTYEVQLNKSLSRNMDASLTTQIGVSFSDPEAVRNVLGSVAQGFLPDLRGKIQSVLDKNPLSRLNEEEKQLARKVAAAIGLGEKTFDTVASLKQVLDERLGRLIEEIATSRVRAGFAYEYHRLSASEVLLRAELSEEALLAYHAGLIRFDLEGRSGRPGLLSDLRAAEAAGTTLPGVTLKNYLNEQSVTRRQAWGFSLGLNKWVLQGKDNLEVREVVRTNIQHHRQVAFRGVRGYAGNLFGSEHSWRVDFNAEMDRFSQRPMPLVSEFRYGLYLVIEWKRQRSLNSETIGHLIDQAVLWDVLAQEQATEVREQLRQVFRNEKTRNVQTSVHLTFKPETFSVILSNIGFLLQNRPQHNTDLIAQALAAAMSYREDFPVRRTVENRKAVYGPLWKACLLKPDGTENNSVLTQDEIMTLAFAAREQLKKFGENLLAQQETDLSLQQKSFDSLFSSLLTMNPSVRADWSLFRLGVTTLFNGLNQGLIYEEVIKRAFRSLQAFWSQEHYVRALGHYLLGFATNELLREGVDRSLTVQYETDGGTRVINLVGKSA